MRHVTHISLLTSLLLAACSTAPRAVSSDAEQQPIRAAARQFVSALQSADESQLRQTSIVDPNPDTRQLASAVIADAVAGRRLQLALVDHFSAAESRAGIVGSEPWLAQLQGTAEHGPILQAGNRVRVGERGRDGSLFLRNIAGQWKVELVPTLVAESGGNPQVNDPIVDYRFNVTRAANQYFLSRLQNNEFTSFNDFTRAKNEFWFEYLNTAAKGEDPHDKLLGTLPPIPRGPDEYAIDR